MAMPTVEEVTTDVQALLGDDSTLLLYTQARQQPFFGIAYREMWDLMMAWKLQTVFGSATGLAPAHVGVLGLSPEDHFTVLHMGEPFGLFERRPGGTDRDWVRMEPVDNIVGIAPANTLRCWMWSDNKFIVAESPEDRQILLQFLSSGDAPVSGPILVDNSRSFLATRTASLMALPYGMPQLAATYRHEALGASGEPDGTGGLLRKLLYPMLREKQNRAVVPPRFRARRAHP